jgi:putative peptide zinc metalloprotease protein
MKQPNQTLDAFDLANLRLRLRRSLKFELQEYGGRPCYIVKNQVTSAYYQVGIAEYAFISLLDGTLSLQQAVQQTAYKLGEDAFSIRDAVKTCQWLIQHGFADPLTTAGDAAQTKIDYLLEERSTQKRQRVISRLNPLFIKLPIFNPTSLLEACSPKIGWIASKTFFGVWVALIIAAVLCLIQSQQKFMIASQRLLVPNAWIWITVTLVGMKIVHELAHGLFCQRFGGQVREAGVVFILFFPIPYVDVTSCWGFPCKWRRIAVSAAGMYVELFLAALATIGWSLTNDEVFKFHLFNIMLVGSLTTLLFNANFLMRFDGYYMLSDLVEIPNLARLGQQYLHYLGKRYLLGMKLRPDRYSRGHSLLIKVYGVMAACWRIVIYVSLSILATALFYGFGVALAILGAALWLGIPLVRFAKLVVGKDRSVEINIKHLALVAVPACGGLLLAVWFLPWPLQVSAPALVKYGNPTIVRAEAPGFVTEILVSNGEFVEKGEVLVKLENRELFARFRRLEAARQRSLVRSRRHHSVRAIAAYQSEVADRLAIEQKIDEVSRQLECLTLRAPVSGMVIGRELNTRMGQFASIGTELLRIVDEQRKEIVVSVGQDEFDAFSAGKGQTAVFAPLQTLERFAGRLAPIEPIASSAVDIRLTSFAGGPLAVQPGAGESSDTQYRLELLQPRFKGIVSLQPAASERLVSGTTGRVRLNRYPESFVAHVVKGVRRWIHCLLEAAERQADRTDI